MKKIIQSLVILPITIAFCYAQDMPKPKCNKEEFLKRNYLGEKGINPEDLGFLEWVGAYQKINKTMGLIAFLDCQSCAKWESEAQARKEKIVQEKQRELDKIKKYKDKIEQRGESGYNSEQRRKIMFQYRWSQKRMLEEEYKAVTDTHEFKELDSAVSSHDWDLTRLDECERKPKLDKYDTCKWQQESFDKSKERLARAIKDFEELPEAQAKNVKNPFVD